MMYWKHITSKNWKILRSKFWISIFNYFWVSIDEIVILSFLKEIIGKFVKTFCHNWKVWFFVIHTLCIKNIDSICVLNSSVANYYNKKENDNTQYFNWEIIHICLISNSFYAWNKLNLATLLLCLCVYA